jgi:hypothetical protein
VETEWYLCTALFVPIYHEADTACLPNLLIRNKTEAPLANTRGMLNYLPKFSFHYNTSPNKGLTDFPEYYHQGNFHWFYLSLFVVSGSACM